MCLLKYNNIATKDQFKARHYKQNYWLNLRFCFHNVVNFDVLLPLIYLVCRIQHHISLKVLSQNEYFVLH